MEKYEMAEKLQRLLEQAEEALEVKKDGKIQNNITQN